MYILEAGKEGELTMQIEAVHSETSKLDGLWSALEKKGLKLSKGLKKTSEKRLPSGVERLDQFLEGGLPLAALSEWGLPLGGGGRAALLPIIARHVGQGGWCLWVSGFEDWRPWPPKFFAAGIAPERLVFAQSNRPLDQLKRALIHPLFSLVILDSPKGLGPKNCSFLAAHARDSGQSVVVIRPFMLSNDQGNNWARFRLNVRRFKGGLKLQALRGLKAQELYLNEGGLTPVF